MSYIVPVAILTVLCVFWAVFQLLLGRQADGTPLDSEERTCHGCGAVQNDERS